MQTYSILVSVKTCKLVNLSQEETRVFVFNPYKFALRIPKNTLFYRTAPNTLPI